MPAEDGQPQTVFHYTSASAFKAIVTYFQAWASKIQHLDDEREYIEYIDAFERISISRFRRSEHDESDFLDFVLETTGLLARANIFVASFTERGDLLSQWRGYCPAGGYSVGFNLEKLISAVEGQGLNICKAIYAAPDEEEIALFLENLFRDFLPLYRAGESADQLDALRHTLETHIFREAPKYKHPGFIEESEWRVYSKPLDRSDSRIDVVDIRGTLRPILKFDLIGAETITANDNSGKSIQNVYVSPGPDRELRREAAAMLLKHLDVNYTRVELSNVPYTPR
ncbi:MAG: DUF2971 domain-containing protein [Phenylobacterium sp.]|uniref:DUF2971 domain-containing protein n=1 Tax=Phenylobacterium sp. TaxID=1871053 RepID=UPI00272FEB5C|nr:DUF2971 domain-containing protein [Phenylobacterium sp.]MDP2011386.1 DUF2971 domain-containing protein [Phenylobacterium sp.]